MCVKRLIIVFLSTVACLSTSAYNDYRNARVDSLEAALASKNPPKGADLLSAYDELMRGYLPFDSLKATDYAAWQEMLNSLQTEAEETIAKNPPRPFTDIQKQT